MGYLLLLGGWRENPLPRLLVLSLAFLAVEGLARGDDTVSDILLDIERVHRENLERIETFHVSGRHTFSNDHKQPKQLQIFDIDADDQQRITEFFDGSDRLRTQEASVVATVCRDSDLLRSSFRQVGGTIYRDVNRGRELRLTPKYPSHRESIITLLDYYSVSMVVSAGSRHQFYEGSLPTAPAGNRIIERRSSGAGHAMDRADVFDPRHLFEVGNVPAEYYLRKTRELHDDGTREVVRVPATIENADFALTWMMKSMTVVLDVGQVNSRPMVLGLTASIPGKGSNLTRHRYEHRDDIAFPVYWSDETRKANGFIDSRWEVSIDEWSVNDDCDPGLFEPLSLANEDGDRFIDYDTKDVKIVYESSMISPEEFREVAAAGGLIDVRTTHRLVSYFCAVICILGIGCLVWIRRSQSE